MAIGSKFITTYTVTAGSTQALQPSAGVFWDVQQAIVSTSSAGVDKMELHIYDGGTDRTLGVLWGNGLFNVHLYCSNSYYWSVKNTSASTVYLVVIGVVVPAVDVTNTYQTITGASGSYVSIQPSSGDEWVVKNIYTSGLAQIATYGSTVASVNYRRNRSPNLYTNLNYHCAGTTDYVRIYKYTASDVIIAADLYWTKT